MAESTQKTKQKKRGAERWEEFINLVIDNRLSFTMPMMAEELGVGERMVRYMMDQLRREYKVIFTKNDRGEYKIEDEEDEEDG